MNKFRLWDETGFNYIFKTNANRENVIDAIKFVEENVDNYNNESIVVRLEEKGFMVVVYGEVPQENTIYWG